FYCDYCDTYLTHDSPSVRKTHCSGRKHKENVKDYYQKWMEEQAQSLIDKTTAAFQQGKIPPTPFSAPPPGGAMIPPPPNIPGPPRPGMMPAPHMGGPPMMPMMGPPPPGMMPVGPGIFYARNGEPFLAQNANLGMVLPVAGAKNRANSRNETAHGRTYANDARATDDETSSQTHDGANQTRNGSSRQIKWKWTCIDLMYAFL
ncbi:hypothetical protein JD844_018294, partial [Phrynosoma platyrhinos]